MTRLTPWSPSSTSRRPASRTSGPWSPFSPYGSWRDQVLLALRRYALDDHVLVDSPIEARDVTWMRLDSVALSWIFGTISLDLQDLVRTHGGTARQAWVALEG